MSARSQTSPDWLVPTATLVAAFVGAIGLRVSVVDAKYGQRHDGAQTLAAVSAGPAALRALTAEHQLAAADLYWLAIVQEFGKAIEGEEVDDDAILVWARAATDLDPFYLTVYHSVAVNFTVYSRRVDDSDALLRKGWAVMPNAWQLPFMLGYNDYFLRSNILAAAEIWEKASMLPGRPRFLLSLAARARYQTGDMLGAEQVLEDMIPFLDGPALEDAKIRLKAFRSEPILAAYDVACQKYLERTGARSAEAQVLEDEGLVDAEPFDLFGKPIVLDETCRARTEYIKVREDEALERVGKLSHTAPQYLDIIRGQK